MKRVRDDEAWVELVESVVERATLFQWMPTADLETVAEIERKVADRIGGSADDRMSLATCVVMTLRKHPSKVMGQEESDQRPRVWCRAFGVPLSRCELRVRPRRQSAVKRGKALAR